MHMFNLTIIQGSILEARCSLETWHFLPPILHWEESIVL